MMTLFMGNPLCWAMVIVGWFAFQQIWMLYFTRFEHAEKSIESTPLMLPSVLVGALPLMGLLGTIMGLEGSFTGMMTEGADSQIVSAGIADALFTTQLGLVMAIPGWLCLTWVKGQLPQPQSEILTHG
ncbi:MotA/TolQ/ExbB proton channel family protein [Alteromonas sp. C1M14]|uniref:MotA/TolQ/ExbB proton channel family protein n=1 Tax=Alteromonas sp. C1M14 TaxID=2841567 RepID=UPI001C090572|nr:MotA/TolQ/ExbB proton channel family protein [Alteromonas sp. C1M14]MBU2978293.1 MotA/TolQ/ExbB proton channel family protein [Alteromonas sp. C1M14]